MSRRQVVLELENGEKFFGNLIGSSRVSSGELVFTTGMVGYSEAISDPSYFGQILVFSYPLIGNYGVPSDVVDVAGESLSLGYESGSIHAAAVVVGVDSMEAFHWRSQRSLDEWLKQAGIPGIVGIDTRMLVQKIRGGGSKLARVVPAEPDEDAKNFGILKKNEAATSFFDPAEHDLTALVSCKEPRSFGSGKKRVAIFDFGVKENIIRECLSLGCEVVVYPWDTPPQSIDASGWLLSNGPGDPGRCLAGMRGVRELLEQERPVLGICLGHQLLAKAAGFKTEKMKFGHRSHNQPVEDLSTGLAYITSQNHGYVVSDSDHPEGWEVWFRNLNDGSIEGLCHQRLPFKSVQFHPESAGGPKDTSWILKQFIDSL